MKKVGHYLLTFVTFHTALAGFGAFLPQEALAQNRVVVIPMFGDQVNRVAKTGQTASSTPGDDGDLEKGLSWPVPVS